MAESLASKELEKETGSTTIKSKPTTTKKIKDPKEFIGNPIAIPINKMIQKASRLIIGTEFTDEDVKNIHMGESVCVVIDHYFTGLPSNSPFAPLAISLAKFSGKCVEYKIIEKASK